MIPTEIKNYVQGLYGSFGDPDPDIVEKLWLKSRTKRACPAGRSPVRL